MSYNLFFILILPFFFSFLHVFLPFLLLILSLSLFLSLSFSLFLSLSLFSFFQFLVFLLFSSLSHSLSLSFTLSLIRRRSSSSGGSQRRDRIHTQLPLIAGTGVLSFYLISLNYIFLFFSVFSHTLHFSQVPHHFDATKVCLFQFFFFI